jgi:crotonobetainyl-CoA:carnitine CoA-transferase CaiB-like acyl-CoA transferase
MMEGMLPEYGKLGKIKQPTGGGIATAAPSNAYPTKDGAFILIAANSEPLFTRLVALLGQPQLAGDPRFSDNPARVTHASELDEIIGEWTVQRTSAEAKTLLDQSDIPNSKAYTAEDVAQDAQFLFRGMVRKVNDPALGTVLHSGVVPHIPECPGEIRWPGPAIGQHSEEILSLAGYSREHIAEFKSAGVIR